MIPKKLYAKADHFRHRLVYVAVGARVNGMQR